MYTPGPELHADGFENEWISMVRWYLEKIHLRVRQDVRFTVVILKDME